MATLKNKSTYKNKGNYSPIPRSRIQKGAKTIIALRGCDWNRIHIKDIRRLQRKIGAVLALDDFALAHAVKHGIDVLLLEDFIEHSELVDIEKQIYKLINSWGHKLANVYTFDNINFAEVDRRGLNEFWNQVVSAYICAKKINEKKLHVILIDEDENTPLNLGRSEIFCKVCSLITDSYSTIILKNHKKYTCTIKEYTFSLNTPIDNKPVAVLANYELKRDEKLLAKLKHIHSGLNIICSSIYDNQEDMNADNELNGIPIYNIYEHDASADVNFAIPSFNDVKSIIGFLPEELHTFIYQALEFYFTKYYPSLLCRYYAYKNLFIKHRPLCVFGVDEATNAENAIPLLAANALDIPTFSWGHALTQSYKFYNRYVSTYIIHTAQGMRNAVANNIPKNKLLLIKDQGELNILYKVEPYFWNAHKDVIKILVLPSPIKVFGTSIGYTNSCRQMEVVKILCSPPKHLAIDLKFKEHPGFDSPSIYPLLNIDRKKWAIPASANLLDIMNNVDICILLGEIGCALLHISKLVPTLFITYAVTLPYKITNEYPNKKVFTYDQAINDFPNKIDNPKDIWTWIEKVLTDESYKKTIMEKQQQFHYIDENTITFEQAMEEKLSHLQIENNR